MQFQGNYSLKSLNSFGININAKYFTKFADTTELEESLETFRGNKLILGGGSNILFTQNFNGLVLKNEIDGIGVINEDEQYVYVKVGAGVGWHSFVLYCIQNNFAGAENLSLIPGSVGASPMQNIGAYGVEIKDIFHELEAFHINDKKIVTFTNKDCDFGYRESVFKNKYKGQFVITSVTFRLNKEPVFNTSYGAIENELQRMGIQDFSIKAISDAVINIRRSKLPDPKIIGNAGSFFKNPTVKNEEFENLKKEFPEIVGYAIGANETKIAAGWLIEKCGFKGYRLNDAGCHKKQALVLVNYGHATGEEILHVSEKIINAVKLMFGVTLQREVNIV